MPLAGAEEVSLASCVLSSAPQDWGWWRWKVAAGRSQPCSPPGTLESSLRASATTDAKEKHSGLCLAARLLHR